MTNPNQMIEKCVCCETTENELPLISISYKQNKSWTCFRCLPLLLHGKKNIDDFF